MIIKDTCNGIEVEIDTKKELVTFRAGIMNEQDEIAFAFRTWTDIRLTIDRMMEVGATLKKVEQR